MNNFSYILFVSLLLLGGCKQSSSITNPRSDNNNFKATFHQGVRNYIIGNNAKAILDFEACVKLNPSDDAIHFALAQLYLMEGQLEIASIHSELAAKLDPKNSYYIAELAYMYVEQKQYKKAALYFEQLIKTDKSNANYYMGAINNYAECKEYAKALKILNRLIEQKGKNSSFQMEKHRLYVLMNETELAIKTLEEGRKLFNNDPVFLAVLVDTYMENRRYDVALELLDDLVIQDPENGLATLLLGEMYIEKKEYQKGIYYLKSAIKKEGPTIDQKMNILIQMQKTEGCGPDIYDLVNYMVVRYPENAKSFTIKGDCCVKDNDLIGAIEAYHKAVEKNPNLLPVWQQILILEFQSEKWTSLYKSSLEAISLFPTNTFVSLSLGIAANKMGRFNEALLYLDAGLQYIINDDATEAEMYAQIGGAYFGLKQASRASESYKMALKKAPDNPAIHATFALQLAQNNTALSYAEELSRFSISKEPNNGLFLAIKGFIELSKMNYESALLIMMEAKTLSPNNAQIMDWLGDTYYFNNKIEAAIVEWKLAKLNGSNNELLLLKIESKKYYAPTN